jgi:hypothetical protein
MVYSDNIIDELTKQVLASVSVRDYCNDIDKWVVKNNNSFGEYDTTITITTNKVDTIVSSDTKSSVRIVDYHDDIDKRIMKINNLDKSSTSSSSASSMATEIKPTEKILTKVNVRKISNGIVSKCKQTNNNFKDVKNDNTEKSNKSKVQKRKINDIEISSKEDNNNNNKLDPLQLLLFKKGRKLNKILQQRVNDDDALIISNQSISKIINILNELSAEPIKIIDENSAEARIYQWQKQELQFEKLRVALESYNLLHLMSLIQIYEGLLKVGEKLKNIPENNVKTWVIEFIRNRLNIKSKIEQRNRLGCNRLLKLFNEGITSEQLVQAGCHKCDFFVKQESYDIFLSQFSSSSNLSNEYFSKTLSSESSNINFNKSQFIYNNEEFDNNNNTNKSSFIHNNNQNIDNNEVKQITSNKKQKFIHLEEI